MGHIRRIQHEGKDLLQTSGWAQIKIEALLESLIDFTSQAFFDEMYQDAKLELFEDKDKQTLDIIWKTNRLKVRVILYDSMGAYWDLFAGRIIDGVEVETESPGAGDNSRFFECAGSKGEDEKWAFHFYWWLDDYLYPDND